MLTPNNVGIEVLAQFQLKITLIGEAVANKVILQQIWSIELISQFSNIYNGNTQTDRVSSENDHDWCRYCQKGNFATNNTHVWSFLGPNSVQIIQVLNNVLIL